MHSLETPGLDKRDHDTIQSMEDWWLLSHCENREWGGGSIYLSHYQWPDDHNCHCVRKITWIESLSTWVGEGKKGEGDKLKRNSWCLDSRTEFLLRSVAQNGWQALVPTLYCFTVVTTKVKEMAVAAIACVDGIPYSFIVLFSSFTAGGVQGRGHLRRSFKTWPIYMTSWKQNIHVRGDWFPRQI